MVELVLMKDVENLGKRGIKVRVREGYARNFLLPTGSAVPATVDNLRMVEKARVRWLAEEAKLIEDLRELAGHIAKLDLVIIAKASDQGHLYGSITEKTIAEAAKAKGVAFDAKAVRLAHHLKEIGDYEVLVHLHEQVEVTIPVKARGEGRPLDWVPSRTPEAQAPAPATPPAPAPES